jgi:hypothetical protein
LDIGCSVNNNLKCIVLGQEDDFLYFPTPVVVNVADKARQQYTIDETKTRAVRRLLLDHQVELEQGIGLDLYDWRSPELAAHTRSSTFYLDELENTGLVQQYDRIVAATPDNVSFQQVDVTIDYDSPGADEALERARRKIVLGRSGLQKPQFDELFDVVCLRTVLYQLPASERRAALENAHKWVKPDGIIMVQDFINMGHGVLSSIIPQKKWAGNYKTWIKDMSESEPGFMHYLSADSGRARRVILMPELAKLALAREYQLV